VTAYRVEAKLSEPVMIAKKSIITANAANGRYRRA